MIEHMLTTVDNPFSPFTEYEAWFSFDRAAGYDTPGLLARIIKTSDDLSQAEQDQAIEDAINEIVEHNALGLHRKVSLETD